MRWSEIEALVPELAAEVRGFMNAGTHKALATVREDGAPRVSGIEATFMDGDLWIGSMIESPKSRDLMRDPRLALHSASAEPSAWVGDAKVAGTATLVDDDAIKARLLEVRGDANPGPWDLFRVAVTEIVVLRMGDPPDHLDARTWTPDGGERRSELR